MIAIELKGEDTKSLGLGQGGVHNQFECVSEVDFIPSCTIGNNGF